MSKGLPCEICGSETAIVKVVPTESKIHRRRQCTVCDYQIDTVENCPKVCSNCGKSSLGCKRTKGSKNVVVREKGCCLCYYKIETREIRDR